MKKPEEVYKDLKRKYTDEELADSFIFSIESPKEEQQEIREEFLKLRLERLKSMSDEELISLDLFAFKLRLKKYFENDKYDDAFSFSSQLKKYLKITRRSNADVARNLGIHKTKLSRLINQRENPNIDLMYRLETHSSKEIPAFYWWRIFSKELEFKIKTDHEKMLHEADKVENPLKLSA
ncbi:MAG: hypothetical protein AB8H12_24030 [Lewinella sp.]